MCCLPHLQLSEGEDPDSDGDDDVFDGAGEGVLPEHVREPLEYLVYRWETFGPPIEIIVFIEFLRDFCRDFSGNNALLAAYQLYAASEFSPAMWNEFWETLCVVIT